MALATEATNSQGIALENQEKYEDSYVGMLKSISTGWETFLLSITSSAGIKEFLSFVDEMIGKINNLAEGIGGLKVLFAAISTGAMAMSKIEPVSLSYTEKDGISLMILNKALKQNSEQMQADTGFLQQYAAAVGDASRQQQILTDHQGIASLKAREFAIQTKGTAFSVEAYSLKMKGLQAQLTASTIKTNVLNLALKALSVGITLGLNILAMFLIDQFVKLADEILPKTTEEIEQMKQESLEAIASLKTAFDELNKSAKGYAEQFAELSQGVNQLTGENVSLSTEDYDTFLSLSNKLADLFPDLTRVYDDNGNAIVNLTGDIDSIVLKIDELIQKQRELVNEDIVKEFPNVYDSYRKDRNSYNNVINEEESQKKALEESLKSIEGVKSNIRKLLSGDDVSYDYVDTIQRAMFEDLKATLSKEYLVRLEQNTLQNTMYLNERDVINIAGEWTEDDVERIAEGTAKASQKTQEVVQEVYSETIKELETGKKNLSDAIADMDKVTQAYLVNLDGYQDIVNKYGSKAGTSIQSMLKNIDWLDMGIKEKEIMPWIENTIDTINESAPDIAEKITNIFSGVDIPAEELFSNIGDVVNFFVNNGIEIPYTLIEKSDSIKDITERIEAIKGKFIRAAGESGGEVQAKLDELAINELFEEFDIDSAEDYEYFLSVVQGAKNATEAVEMYKEAVNASLNLSFIDRDEISSSLDEIQSAYSTVSGAISDYNETGVLSLENVQSLLELDDKYLAMLINENGQLILNTDSYNKLTLAQLENLKVTAIAESIKSIDELVDEESALKRLSQATIQDTDATWDNLTAKVASYKTSLMIERTQGKDVTARLAAVDQIVQSTEHQIMLVDTAIRDMMTNSSAFYGESAKSGTDSLVDAFDDAYEKLNVLRDADAISELEYLERLRALNSEYYKDKEKYAKEFYEYEKEYFEGMIGVYDTVIGVVQDKIDKQIDLLEDQKDSVTSYYESLIDANDKKIESYDAEIDALNAANDARELALSLEDAIWEDRKANEQRPNLTYDNGQFVYDTDRDAQKSAREALEKVRLDIQISEIEKLKDALESANKQLEIALKKETDAIDANIDALEKYKDKWEEISSITSDLRNNEMAEQLLGKNWEADILNTRLQNWEDFKNKYIETQKEMAAAAAAYAGNPTTPTASTSSGQTTGSNTSTKKIVGYTVNGKTYASLELATRAQTAIYTAQKSAIERSYLDPYEKALKIKSLLQEVQKKYPIVPVKAYKRGGIVGDDDLLNKAGEDQLAALSYGEGILTPKETDAYVDSAPEIPALVDKLDEFMSNGIPDSWMMFIDAISGFKDNPNFAYENGLIKEAASKVVGDTVNNNEKSIVIQFGDIYVSGVDDANSFAREIVNRLPNAVARELGK